MSSADPAPLKGWGRLADLGFVTFLAACVIAAGLALGYHGNRLEREAVQTQHRLLEAETRHTLDHLAQSLHTVDLTLQSLLEAGHTTHGLATWETLLRDALRHSPHLRSISLLDDQGRVVVSSNPANLGLQPAQDDYLPQVPRWTEVMRIGRLHAGRDLADGQPLADPGAAPPVLGFVPVIRGLHRGEAGSASLIATLNIDYFLNRIGQRAGTPTQVVEVLRFDGAPLMSTRESAQLAAVSAANAALVQRWGSGEELGALEQDIAGGGRHITAWRVARVLPVAMVARLDHEQVVAEARVESQRQSRFLLPLVSLAMGVVLVAYLLFRRTARRQMAMQAEESARMAQLLDALPASVLLFGSNGHTLLANHAWRLFASAGNKGRLPDDYRHYAELFADNNGTDAGLEKGIVSVLQGRQAAFEGEFQLRDDEGAGFHILVRPFRHDGTHGVAVLQLDVSARRQAEERNELLLAALNATVNAVVITDRNAVIQWANPAFSVLTGYEVEDAIGRKPKDLVSSGRQSAEFYTALWETILRGEPWRGELVNRRKNGQLYHESLTITPVRNRKGRLAHFVAIKEDIEERKQHEHELERLASTDPLTGVFNRRVFIDKLNTELARVRRYGGESALLMLDLDHFKRINDSYGHAAGDAVLQTFAGLAAAALRQTDALGRLGGEEFAIVLPETGLAGAVELAERLRGNLEKCHVSTDEHSIQVTVSIGVAMLETVDTHADTVLARADDALYRAKSKGRNCVVCAEAAA